jgi:dTDP-glucose 4,6-dehydratase
VTRTILVTGGAGFVGSHLIQHILETTDWRVLSVDSFQGGGKFFNLIDACGWPRDRVVSLTHDLTIPFTRHQRGYIGSYQVDAIVNLASRSHVGESIAEPVTFVGNNVQLMLTVLELAVDIDVDRFVHLSTDEVYGPREPKTDWDLRPSSPYAGSKAAQEMLCHSWRRTYDLPLTIVNSANMIGERQGETAFLPLVVDNVVHNRSTPIHVRGNVIGERHYTYVGNVVDELIAEIQRPEPCGRLQLGGQQTLTNVEVVRRVGDILGVTPRWHSIEATGVRPGYDQHYPQLCDDWRPREAFDLALARTVRWYADD